MDVYEQIDNVKELKAVELERLEKKKSEAEKELAKKEEQLKKADNETQYSAIKSERDRIADRVEFCRMKALATKGDALFSEDEKARYLAELKKDIEKKRDSKMSIIETAFEKVKKAADEYRAALDTYYSYCDKVKGENNGPRATTEIIKTNAIWRYVNNELEQLKNPSSID